MKRSITVPGIPAPQGSKRHVGNGVMREQLTTVKPYRDSVMAAAIEDGWADSPILTGPVRVTLHFFLPRPKAHYGTGKNANTLKKNAPMYHSSTKDVDKLSRAVLDALTNAGVWRDDGQVAWLTAQKFYGVPHTDITLMDLCP